jgi:hypothetical protein
LADGEKGFSRSSPKSTDIIRPFWSVYFSRRAKCRRTLVESSTAQVIGSRPSQVFIDNQKSKCLQDLQRFVLSTGGQGSKGQTDRNIDEHFVVILDCYQSEFLFAVSFDLPLSFVSFNRQRFQNEKYFPFGILGSDVHIMSNPGIFASNLQSKSVLRFPAMFTIILDAVAIVRGKEGERYWI